MRRHHAYRRGTDPGEMQSMQLPSHWDPMRAREDCRLADICMRPGEEYSGDLEGWEVEWLSLVSMCVSVPQLAQQTCSLSSTSMHHCPLLWQGYVLASTYMVLRLVMHTPFLCRPCTFSSQAAHHRWARAVSGAVHAH